MTQKPPTAEAVVHLLMSGSKAEMVRSLFRVEYEMTPPTQLVSYSSVSG